MSEELYSDFELRKLLNQHKMRSQDIEGGDSRWYKVAKIVRDAIEKKLVGEKDPPYDPTLLINVFGDNPGDDILTQLIKDNL